ncbi:MAG: VWA domain-containing protein [Actinobacteria bacterium]|nr:VWA domain-containing protein [Actinomycetota bacterium]MBV8479115.1 VWA domain-containing protein [Actinomycetota bacterium]
MSFGSPYLLLTLLVIPLGVALYLLSERRRMRYAVRYTNVDVLASVAGGRRSWRRIVTGAVFLLALATLCVAVARPRVHTLVPSDRATIVLVLDVSGSMQANDVKPTRLAAAQEALNIFLDKVPKRVRLSLILFAGEPVEAAPPTTDHALVRQAVNDANVFEGGMGGTAIGDALSAAVRVGLRSAGVQSTRSLAAYEAAPPPSSTLVTILFLSDGHQNRGTLQPLQGAAVAKKAGIPVYTVALGTPGGKITNFNFGGNFFNPNGGGPGLRQALAPDPNTLHAIANATGGKFYEAKTAGAVTAAYSKLGSSLGRVPGRDEVTVDFAVGAAVLLLAAGILGALWAPRLP